MKPKYQVCIKLKPPTSGNGTTEISFAQPIELDDPITAGLKAWCKSHGFGLAHSQLPRKTIVDYNTHLYDEKKVVGEIVSLLKDEGFQTFVFVKETHNGDLERATLEELSEIE